MTSCGQLQAEAVFRLIYQVRDSTMAAAPSSAPTSRFFSSFGIQVLAGLVLGLLLGLVARAIGPAEGGGLNALAVTLDLVGSIFVQLLRALVPALVFTAIVASIANLRQLSNAAALVWNTLLWFAITAFIAVLIGIALGLIIRPGLHTGVTAAAEALPRTSGAWLDFLRGLVPSNIFGLEANTRVNNGSRHHRAEFQCASAGGHFHCHRRRCLAGGRERRGVPCIQ